MAKRKNPTLVHEPLPQLEWDDFFWSTTINLPSWKGFQCRLGPYASRTSHKKSEGTVKLVFATPFGEKQTPPSLEQVAAYVDLIADQERIRDSILNAVFDEYPSYRASNMADFGLSNVENSLPVLDRPSQLKDMIGLSSLLVHRVMRDGVGYVGYEFGCAWEEEHGLGAMLHSNRVVKVGHADVGILEWIAERDAKPTRQKKTKRKK